MTQDRKNDGANQVQPGGGESGGGKWPGENDEPAKSDVVTHNVTENTPVRDKE